MFVSRAAITAGMNLFWATVVLVRRLWTLCKWVYKVDGDVMVSLLSVVI